MSGTTAFYEFEINGHQYRSTKLNVIKQFHIARKIGPVFARLGPDFVGAADVPEMMRRLAVVTELIGEMSEQDCEYIIAECLGVVRRIVNGNALPVWRPGAGLMFQEDLELPEMLQIVKEVIFNNLGNFINVPPSASDGPPPTSIPQN